MYNSNSFLNEPIYKLPHLGQEHNIQWSLVIEAERFMTVLALKGRKRFKRLGVVVVNGCSAER